MKCPIRRIVRSVVVLMAVLVTAESAPAQDDLTVLTGWRQFSDARYAFYKYMAEEAYEYLDARDARLAALNTAADWTKYRDGVRMRLSEAFGPLPSKTPLKARTVSTFLHEGIAGENILFESRPGFQVTATLFRPADKSGKLPVVIYVCGHTSDGYRSSTYQHVILNLASKGIAVLAIDPVGQGERIQYFDPETGKSSVGGPTNEHSYAGLQYLPLGRTMAMVRLWDCIRAVDYLFERDDIDTAKIGVHGRSGGGTMSAFLGAMDLRVTAAAPECYITTFRRLIQSIGPQDAEQNLLGQISSGLDHGDFFIARMPLPTLHVGTTRDFFSIQGVHETAESVVRGFNALGSAGNFAQIEDDAPHMSTKANRERVYAFFMKTFGVTGDRADKEIPYIPAETLTVTSTGQTVTSGSRHIHDFILEDAEPLLMSLDVQRADPVSAGTIRADAARLSGYRKTSDSPENIFAGQFSYAGYTVEKHIFVGERGMPIPCLVYVPDSEGPYPPVLIVDPAGKTAVTGENSFSIRLVSDGNIVFAPDLPGCGELAGDIRGDDSVIAGVSYNLVFGAQLIGRSVTGIQASVLSDVATAILDRTDTVSGRLTLIGRGILGPAALHAAAIDRRFTSTMIIDAPMSWVSMVETRMYDNATGSTIVPSALTKYDLPDLAGTLSPANLLIVDPRDGAGNPMGRRAINDISSIIAKRYASNSGNLSIETSSDTLSDEDILFRWLRKVR